MTTYSTDLEKRNYPYLMDVAQWATINAPQCVTSMNSDVPMISQFRNGRGRRLCSFP